MVVEIRQRRLVGVSLTSQRRVGVQQQTNLEKKETVAQLVTQKEEAEKQSVFSFV